MTSWERVSGRASCGRCGRELETGDPVFVITLERGTLKPRRLLRCDPCGGSAPPDLPAVIKRAVDLAPRVMLRGPWADVDAPARREDRRVFGGREPGEEG